MEIPPAPPAPTTAENKMLVKISTDDDGPKLYCPVCDKAFTSLNGYAKHVKKHEPPGGFLCRYCDARYCNDEELKRHRDEVHTIIKCRLCTGPEAVTFTSEEAYRAHIRYTHDGIDRELFKCNKCGAEYKTVGPYQRHMATECGRVKPHKCDLCPMAFVTKYNLKHHRDTHGGEAKFCCSYCGKHFLQKSRLVEHERSHTGEKPYKCDVCGKCFAHRESIVTHSSIHTGIRLVECRSCLARFSCYSNLIKHRRARPDTCGLPQFDPPKNRTRTRRSRIPATLYPTSEIKVCIMNKMIRPTDAENLRQAAVKRADKAAEREARKCVTVAEGTAGKKRRGRPPRQRPAAALESDDEVDDSDDDATLASLRTTTTTKSETHKRQTRQSSSKTGFGHNLESNHSTNHSHCGGNQHSADDLARLQASTKLPIKSEKVTGEMGPTAEPLTNEHHFEHNIKSEEDLFNEKDQLIDCLLMNASVGEPERIAQPDTPAILAETMAMTLTATTNTDAVDEDDEKAHILHVTEIILVKGEHMDNLHKEDDGPEEVERTFVDERDVEELQADFDATDLLATEAEYDADASHLADKKKALKKRAKRIKYSPSPSPHEHDDSAEALLQPLKKRGRPRKGEIRSAAASKGESLSPPAKCNASSQSVPKSDGAHLPVRKGAVRSATRKAINRTSSPSSAPTPASSKPRKRSTRFTKEGMQQRLLLSRRDDNHIWKCEHCNRTYCIRKPFEKHLREFHQRPEAEIRAIFQTAEAGSSTDDLLKCHICHKVYLMEKRLTAHVKLHGDDGLLIFKCPCFCKLYFATQAEALAHAHTEHRRLLYCERCDKCLNTTESHRIHMQTVHNQKRRQPAHRDMVCDKCGKKFDGRTRLNDHVRSDCGRTKLYTCTVCGKELTTMGILKTHMLLHQDEEPYQCEQCGKRFKVKHRYKHHLKERHTEGKPFKCHLCPKEYPYRESLFTHMAVHTGVKRFLCNGCGKRFTCISNLQSHRKVNIQTCGQLPLNTKASQYMGVQKGTLLFGTRPEPGVDYEETNTLIAKDVIGRVAPKTDLKPRAMSIPAGALSAAAQPDLNVLVRDQAPLDTKSSPYMRVQKGASLFGAMPVEPAIDYEDKLIANDVMGRVADVKPIVMAATMSNQHDLPCGQLALSTVASPYEGEQPGTLLLGIRPGTGTSNEDTIIADVVGRAPDVKDIKPIVLPSGPSLNTATSMSNHNATNMISAHGTRECPPLAPLSRGEELARFSSALTSGLPCVGPREM